MPDNNCKPCIVCSSKKWDYDVATADGKRFCGDCWFIFRKAHKEINLKSYLNSEYQYKPMSRIIYKKVLVEARRQHSVQQRERAAY